MSIPTAERLAYQQGADAYRAGKSKRINSYMGKRLFNSFNKGWDRAETDDKASKSEEATWRNATPEALLRDEVRLEYWRTVKSENKRNKQKRIDSVLATWKDLLSVRRTINP